MEEIEQQLRKILRILNEEEILNGVILIGSWCLSFYKHIFENFEPNIRSTDIDFYVPNASKIKQKDNLINSFKKINYDIIHDTLTRKSSFISPDGFEIEFLTRNNRDYLTCVKLGNTGIYAEKLSNIEIFTTNYIEVDYFGIKVNVASPASYVLQKLLINQKRGIKKEKDIESVKNVLELIKRSRKLTKEMYMLYSDLPNKWKKKIIETANQNDIIL